MGSIGAGYRMERDADATIRQTCQVAGMSSSIHSEQITDWAALLPDVQLEVRSGNGRATNYALAEVDFLIGSLPGCDLRVAGKESGSVVCLLARHPGGATLRKLSPAQLILVNGRSASHLELANDDRIQFGLVDIKVRIAPPQAIAQAAPDVEQARRELQERILHFREQLVSFQHDKDALEQEKLALAQHPQSQPAIEQWEAEAAALLREIEERDRVIATRDEAIQEQQHELDQLRQEINDRSNQQKRENEERFLAGQQELDRRTIDLTQKTLRFESERRQLEDEYKALEKQKQEMQEEQTIQLIAVQQREQALAEQRHAFEAQNKQYEDDVLRLNRWHGTLEQRDREIEQKTAELERQREELRLESTELETQLLQVEEWRSNLTDEADRLAVQKQQQEALGRELAERTASIEGQQATFSVLRGRLERLREELRTQQQQLDEQRSKQDAREAELNRKTQEMLTLQLDLESQQSQYAKDRQQWLERGAVMETAVKQLKKAQDELAVEDGRVRQVAEELERRALELSEGEKALQDRLTQLAETQERIDSERHSLRERSVNLLQREQGCETLQEQLRRRSEEITQKQKELADEFLDQQAKLASMEALGTQLELREQESKKQFETWHKELEEKALTLNRQQAELEGFENRYQQQLQQIAAQRNSLADDQAQLQRDQLASLERLAQERANFEALRAEAQELIAQLPDAELRAGTALDRLTHARTQMREHLTEIHRYVRQCQDELELVRGRLQNDLDKLQNEEQALRRSQDEHRLAVTAFRQQLIDSQGQIAELKRLLSRDETRLERKQAQVDERARAMEAESERLVRQAEELNVQERDVADRREEIDRHLVDMRQWYRRKLRDLAGIPLNPDAAFLNDPVLPVPVEAADAEVKMTVTEDGEPALVPVGRSILSLTGPVEPGDRNLGQVLREAQLIDNDTLNALLAEARRQRRSLRQVLLSSGVITVYQLALIEAGDTQGLMLGPVRIIDRLRNVAHESVYRVFDPRRGTEAVLRHLAEADMTDAMRPDEFRQRFTQAMLNDLHLANTLEVFDLLGRPAVLQEWLSGLPATDWPPLTAAPGVCYRLLTQAAQGLATSHRAGLVHGHLSDNLLLLTGDGILKILGLGEPPWLIGLQYDEEPTPRDDLRTLGKIVSGWCTPTGVRKGAKTRPLPAALISILYRLAADGDAGYRDVQELQEELEKAASEIPPNGEAWDRLLKYVREHGAAETMVRRSA